MSRLHRRHSPPMRIIAEGVSDREIIAAWHEVAAGGTADCVLDNVMVSIVAALAAIELPDAAPVDADAAIIRSILRARIVTALRKNLMRRLTRARETPELLAGKTEQERLVYLVTGCLVS